MSVLWLVTRYYSSPPSAARGSPYYRMGVHEINFPAFLIIEGPLRSVSEFVRKPISTVFTLLVRCVGSAIYYSAHPRMPGSNHSMPYADDQHIWLRWTHGIILLSPFKKIFWYRNCLLNRMWSETRAFPFLPKPVVS